MIHYKLKLINKNPELNLIRKSEAILDLIERINNGDKEIKNAFKDVNCIELLCLCKNELTLCVDETGTVWHQQFGKKLANDYEMRNFCSDEDPTKLFKWEKIELQD